MAETLNFTSGMLLLAGIPHSFSVSPVSSCVMFNHYIHMARAHTHTHEGNQPEQQRDDVEKERET